MADANDVRRLALSLPHVEEIDSDSFDFRVGGKGFVNRHATSIAPGQTLRVQASSQFVLHWTSNQWQEIHDTQATATALAIYYVDLPTSPDQQAPLSFTFFWPGENRWEGRDYLVAIEAWR